MPTYEYRCADCGTEFEKFGRMSDPPVETCPSCGNQAQRKLSAGAGLLFKGSGFYITDYRGEGYRKAAASEAGGEKGGAEKGGGEGGASKGTEPKGGAAPTKPAKPSTPPPSGGGGGKD